MITPVLFSVSYAGFWGQEYLDLKAFIRKAAALGYPAVEIMGKRPHLSILDMDQRELSAIRDIAAECHIEIATIAAYTDFTNDSSRPEIPYVEVQIAYIRELVRIAQMLGAKIIRVFTGYSSDPRSFQKDWQSCVDAIRECADIAGDVGVIIGVQNHHDIGVGYESFLEFLNDVDHPNCKAMFDPWAPALQNENLRESARLLAPRMVQTTFADYIRPNRYTYAPDLVNYLPLPAVTRAVPLGDGFIDYKEFIAGLKEGGFNGYVAYEMCSPLRGGGSMTNLDTVAQCSLEKIEEWFK